MCVYIGKDWNEILLEINISNLWMVLLFIFLNFIFILICISHISIKRCIIGIIFKEKINMQEKPWKSWKRTKKVNM